jgi:hypothetical protein
MEPKPFLKSKTIWFNVLLPLVTWAAYKVTGLEVPVDVAAGAIAVMQTVGNIILRLLTKQPLE